MMMKLLYSFVIVVISYVSSSLVKGDCELKIDNFSLVNVTTKRTISPLQDFVKESSNAVIAIRANPDGCSTGPSLVKSVYVELDGSLFQHCETFAPYTIFRDTSTMDVANHVANYNGYSLSVGTHIVSAIPYADEKCTGFSGRINRKEFVVTNRVRTPIRSPVRVPTPVRVPVQVPVKVSPECPIGVSTGPSKLCRRRTIDASNIVDPSFEEYKRCPTERFQINLSKRWVSGTDFKPDYWVGAPTCNDTNWRNDGPGKAGITAITQNATDGDAFVGTLKIGDFSYTYVGTCLDHPFVAGVEYDLSMDIAAVLGDVETLGGDTNGAIDLICIPKCNVFPINGNNYKGDKYEILDTAQPNRGLVGGGSWKKIKFNFTPTKDCAGMMFGASKLQVSPSGASYVLYDNLKLKEVIKGVCNDDGRCVSRND